MPRSADDTNSATTSSCETRSATAMIACAPAAHATPRLTFAFRLTARTIQHGMRDVQVAPEHYDFERYDDRERWMSYWHQLRAVLAVRPKTVLEIGPGSGVFRSYLRAAGVDVKTLDIDKTREVDFVADITKLDEALPAGLMFDAVCAFQVLEHLPLAELETCLGQIARRANPHVFVSLPYRGLRVRFAFWWGDHLLTLGHKFMLPWRHKPIPEHHWQLGYPP